MIHKEGIAVLAVIFIIILLVDSIIIRLSHLKGQSIVILVVISLLLFSFFVYFFRNPKREVVKNEDYVYAPADGQVVVIEETTEKECLKDRRIQISIFMSIWDVHINWYPVSGKVVYFKHHPGKYLIAKLPKSSTDNEHTTVVVEQKNGTKILLRQIAGAVARRIVPYAKEGLDVEQGEEMGFIRFGSRVDILLPVGTKIDVKLGQHVTGTQTVIAQLK
ncbi:MAG: phosphatidylserine decarboxylase family protein [Bacteroidota bacterium]|nr:phosphatidylserine decarboxylase family protein [Bacteroidota bacterium]MDP4227616.1 phosphatidylserine decarboxylase family protein [Bacteroidota bacterium]MDP4272897.1 phosphatidylserine decarboxylase family protein [Bacteroidota bacterium]